MKVQTDVKAGGGLLGIFAIVVVDLNLFGGGCGCSRPKNSCGGSEQR